MNFSFEASNQTHTLQLEINNNSIVANLDGQTIDWETESNDLQAPRFYSLTNGEQLRVQFYRNKWYASLNDKPLKNSATVAGTRLKKLSTFIYIIAVFQLILGATIMILDPKPVTITILSFGLLIVASAYLTSKANLNGLIILIALIVIDIIFLCYTMYQYYNIAYENVHIPFFVPCMRVLIEIYFLVVLIPGIEIVKNVREEREKL